MNPDHLDRLSPRKREVYDLTQRGLTPAEIGRQLLISEFTARTFLECAEDDLAVWAEQDKGGDA